MKTGIITMYNGNFNYGGNLQAYALCRLCNELGYTTYQIDYRDSSIVKSALSNIKHTTLDLFSENKEIAKRKQKIKEFNRSIPHSRTYYKGTIYKANNDFDCFIAGSDQVWNPKWMNCAYSLSFCDKRKYKFSYAASLGRTELNENEIKLFSIILKDFNAVSVREKKSVDLLAELSPEKPQWVLDPTLLLTQEEWDVISGEPGISEKYVFCYFLRDDIYARNAAKEYAVSNDLKIVTIPFLSNKYRKCDDGFGDYQLYNVSPGDFISLIKGSEYVFTDSFHAVAFSCIYKKQFCAVNDAKMGAMRDRISSLLSIFDAENHFLKSGEHISVVSISALLPVDYEKYQSDFDDLIEQSKLFLRSNLEIANNEQRY